MCWTSDYSQLIPESFQLKNSRFTFIVGTEYWAETTTAPNSKTLRKLVLSDISTFPPSNDYVYVRLPARHFLVLNGPNLFCR